MGLTISPSATTTNRFSLAGAVAPRVPRLEAHKEANRQDAPWRESRADRSARNGSALGYEGLQQALELLPATASAVPATLLTALIHTMGGAATSVACGLYVNTSI